MSLLSITRVLIFCALIVLSLIELGILAYFTNATTSYAGVYLHSFALGIATSLLTIVTIMTVLIVGWVRKGAVIARVWFELLWTGILWVLWIATAGSITSLGVVTSCDYASAWTQLHCRLYQGSQAFSWLSWLLMFGWFVTLLVLSLINQSKGNGQIWHSSTASSSFSPPEKTDLNQNTPVTQHYTGTTAYTSTSPTVPYSYAPQPQQQQPQQQYGVYGPSHPSFAAPQGYTGTTPSYPGSPPPQQYGNANVYPQMGAAAPRFSQQSFSQNAYPPQGPQGYPPQGAPQGAIQV